MTKYEVFFLFKVIISKDELPLLAGDYVLGYYSSNMQSLIALSPTFQVGFPSLFSCISIHEACKPTDAPAVYFFQILQSERAMMEGLIPENINGLEK